MFLTINTRRDLIAATLELFGTTLFLLLGLGGIQASTAEKKASVIEVTNVQQVLYISTCMGFSLVVTAWIFFR
jgi:aquaporin related protein